MSLIDNKIEDIVIIGAGPSGISAGIYSLRNGVMPIIFHTENSKIAIAPLVENYYGFPDGIEGDKLYLRGLEQATLLGIDIKLAQVYAIENNYDQTYTIKYQEDGKNYELITRMIILATGNKNINPDIKDFSKFIGKGVSYCAYCDGFFYKNKKVGILGSGIFAINELKILMNNTDNIIIFSDGESQDKIKQLLKENDVDENKYEIITNKILKLEGNNCLEDVVLDNGKKVSLDGLFIAIGQASSVDFAKTLGIISNGNNISVNDKMQTNIENIYAAGDITGGLNQVEKAVYQGAVAGLDASTKIKAKKILGQI